MRWICLPQAFRLPFVQALPFGLWMRSDGALYAASFAEGWTSAGPAIGRNRMAIFEPANILPGVKVSGTHLAAQPSLFMGAPWFYASGAGSLFYAPIADDTLVGRWIYLPGASAPRLPVSYTPAGGTVQGDAWFEAEAVVYAFGSSSALSLEPAGTATGGAITAVRDWPRWQRTRSNPSNGLTELGGSYAAQDGASGSLALGTAAWRRSADSIVFALRQDGELAAPSTGAHAIPATDVDPDDTTGDYVFSDEPAWRLRSIPTRGNVYYYTLADGVYTQAGRLLYLGAHCVTASTREAFEADFGSSIWAGEPSAWQ